MVILVFLHLTNFAGQTASQSLLLDFQGLYTTNFNETITFCAFHPKTFELNTWYIIPMLAQSVDSGQSGYNAKGAELTGGTYRGSNGSVVWKGLGFSANGPYDCAFALNQQATEV